MEANILFIDDEKINLFLHKEITRRIFPRCTVFTADSVDAALGLLRINPQLNFVIFLDLNIGSRSGIDFLNAIPFQENAHSVYILSSSIDSNEIEKAMSYKKVEAFFSKPFLPTHLRHALKDYFGERMRNG